MYEVKKAFSYAVDGIGHKLQTCKVGDKVELPAKLGNDLEVEGFVQLIAPENKKVEIVPEIKKIEATPKPRKKVASPVKKLED